MRVPGAFAEEVAIDSTNLTVLPEDVLLSDVALAEPLACALHTVHLGQAALSVPLPDSRLVILGGGAIGLLCALAAQYYGCSEILIAETNPIRSKILEQVTQATTYNPLEGVPEAAQNCDLIIDAVGSAATRSATGVPIFSSARTLVVGARRMDSASRATRYDACSQSQFS